MSENGKPAYMVPWEQLKPAVEAYLELQSQAWLTEPQRKAFTELCKGLSLNPLIREVHATPQWKRNKTGGGFHEISPVVGYEVYLKRGMASGVIEFWNVDFVTDDEGGVDAVFTAKRRDWSKDFKWAIQLKEYNRDELEDKGSKMWKQKTLTMLRKTVIGQGFRALCPETCAGLPYTHEELLATEYVTAEEVPETDIFATDQPPPAQTTPGPAPAAAPATPATADDQSVAPGPRGREEPVVTPEPVAENPTPAETNKPTLEDIIKTVTTWEKSAILDAYAVHKGWITKAQAGAGEGFPSVSEHIVRAAFEHKDEFLKKVAVWKTKKQ